MRAYVGADQDSSPATMMAVRHRRYGTPESLEIASRLPIPVAGTDHVLVRVHAAGVSRGVVHMMTGLPILVRVATGIRRPRQPIPGMDVCGTIASVGSRVRDLEPGQRVFGIAQGSFAEFSVAKAAHVAPAPEDLSDAQCAVLAESGLTAVQALRAGGVTPAPSDHQARVLVLGASGGVGSFAVKLATHWGADVTAVCSARKARYVLDWGATRSFDYREGLPAALDDTYDVILDCAGGTPLARMRSSLQPYGTLVFVGNETGGALTGGYERPFAYQLRMTRHSQRFANLLVRTSPQDLDLLAAEARGGLRPHVHAVRPLADVRESLNDLVAGRVVGKTALTLTETAHH